MTLIISYYYYTQLEQLSVESNEVKGDGSLQSGSCIQGHHIFKNIWNHAVLERLNYGKNSNDPYTVVILNMCLYPPEYALPPHLPSRYLSWKWGSPDSVHFSPLLLGKYLYSNTLLLCICKRQISWLSKIGEDLIWWCGKKIIKLPN